MGFIAKETMQISAMIEDNEGEYKAPAANTDYILTLADGNELTGTKELKERNILTGNIGSVTPRVGQTAATAGLAVEFKAKGTEGGAPEYNALLMSALGTRKQLTSTKTTKTGNTTKILQIEDADIASFAENDIILVKEAGKYHVSPIKAIVTTPGAATIELLVEADDAFSDNVVIAKFTAYRPANTGHKTLSLTRYLENAIVEKGWGLRVTGMALSNFTTGDIANWKFSLEGIDASQETGTNPFSPVNDSALPPLCLSACVWQNGVKIPLNELSLSIENTVGWITSTCSKNGRISSRITKRAVSGTINPYKPSDNVENYTMFKANTPFSLFFYAANPTIDGEFADICAVYLPNCITTELKDGDKDGVITDDIGFSADRGVSGAIDEMVLSFI